MRKLQPYGVTVYNEPTGPRLPTDTPTRQTSTHFGDNPAMRGLVIKGGYAETVPIDNPIPAQGAVFPAFPLVMPSDVAPNAIRPNIVVALNNFRYRHGSCTDETPPAAVVPKRVNPKVQKGRRGTGGRYTVPTPLAVASWPTSSQWLRDRVTQAGLPTADPRF